MRPSFEALYRGHFGLVWSLVTRAGVAPASREDAVQEVWLTVHRRLHSYDGSSPPASWIAGIARHVVWRQIRAVIRARRKLVALDRVTPEGLDDPVLARERVRGIEGVIGSLDPIFRDAFVAVEIHGATGPEAAAQLGLPLNTLYSRLRLARARVQAGLDALEHEPGTDAPRGLADRTWLAIAPSLGLAAAPPAAMLPFTGALVAVVIGAVAGIGWNATPPDRSAAAIEPATVIETRADERFVPTPASPAIAAVTIEPVAIPSDPPPKRAPARADTTGQGGDPPRAGVDAEAALLADALQRLAAGDATAAIDALAEHARRFPDGALALDRRVARVRALCLAGKTAQARGEANTLRRVHPDRAAVVALAEGCAAP